MVILFSSLDNDKKLKGANLFVFLGKAMILSCSSHHRYPILKLFLRVKRIYANLTSSCTSLFGVFFCFCCLFVNTYFFKFGKFHMNFPSFLYICHSYLSSHRNFLQPHLDRQGNPLCHLSFISKSQKILQFKSRKNFHYFCKIWITLPLTMLRSMFQNIQFQNFSSGSYLCILKTNISDE